MRSNFGHSALRTPHVALLLLALAACDDAPRFDGPVELGIASGNGQTATAADSDSLAQPVVARLVREKGGAITFRLVTPLYAQTNVKGVAGQVVNAVPIGECGLVPWNPASTTNADGYAPFYFEPGTAAGTCRAEIRYVDPETGDRAVTDTAVATVEAGPPHIEDSPYAMATGIYDPRDEGRLTFSTASFQDVHGNFNDQFRVEADGWVRTVGDSVGTEDGRSLEVLSDPEEGDTVGLRFLDASDTVFLDAIGEVAPATVNAGDTVYHTWSLQAHRRDRWVP